LRLLYLFHSEYATSVMLLLKDLTSNMEYIYIYILIIFASS
jgi:hypothetical protein